MRKITFLLLLFSLSSLISLESCKIDSTRLKPKVQTVTLLGDTLYTSKSASEIALQNYRAAEIRYNNMPSNADSIIWFGRRTAYLGKFQEAIKIYSIGIEKHPKDPRMYRHRGHRYISTRQYDKAIDDFKKAVDLIKDIEDKVEPDGLPNKRNIPLSTLHGNIWYHLGLAYYLKNDMEKALESYNNRSVTEKYPDNLVSGGYWIYMINRRLGNLEAANEAIKDITYDMDIIENLSYHKMCLFFKGKVSEEELLHAKLGNSSSDVLVYGLGNWYLYEKQDTLKAKATYEKLLEKGSKYSFAYLVAESDYKRLFSID